jgi:hypothetical protein
MTEYPRLSRTAAACSSRPCLMCMMNCCWFAWPRCAAAQPAQRLRRAVLNCTQLPIPRLAQLRPVADTVKPVGCAALVYTAGALTASRGVIGTLGVAGSRGTVMNVPGTAPRVRSHCRFRNRGAKYVSKSGMKWMSGSAKRQYGRAQAAPGVRLPAAPSDGLCLDEGVLSLFFLICCYCCYSTYKQE